jgi:DNA-binding transcriptional LysR family regulator
LLALVESGTGIALVPSVMQRYSSDKLVYRELEDLPVTAGVGLALAYLEGSEMPSARRFRDVASRVFQAQT